MKNEKSIVLLISLILVFMLYSLVFSQQPTRKVTSTGIAGIFSNDIGLARDQALNDAIRKAVEQTLGMFVQSSTLVENSMVVEDNILTWSRGYVRNYKVLREGKTSGDSYEVTIEAEIELANLKNDWEGLQNIINQMGNPRVMFMIDEQNIGQSYNRYAYFSVDMNTTENTLLNKFIQSGFECVDPATVRQNLQQEQALAVLQGNTKMAAAIAKKLGAEVIITGKAIAKVATGLNLGGMKSCQANITARVIKADVATIIATGSAHAAYPHIDEVTGGSEALKKAANKLADDLITKISQKWKDEFYRATTVKVIVQNVKSFNQLNDFKNTLKYLIRGVKDIYSRDVTGSTAELDVKITGNASQLARELEKKNLDKFKVKVVGMTMNKLTLQIEEKSEM